MELKSNARRGFSLLELLVALAVLTVIVVMTSLVFQQTSGIWQNTARANGLDMAARGIIAKIQADLEQAVPAANYNGISHGFGSSSIEFIMCCESDGGSNGLEREAVKVKYEWGGGNLKRTETRLEFDGTMWGPGGNTITKTMPGRVENAEISRIQFVITGGDTKNLPKRVDIEAEVHYGEIKYQSFAGRSLGPNQKDDKKAIYVGGGK